MHVFGGMQEEIRVPINSLKIHKSQKKNDVIRLFCTRLKASQPKHKGAGKTGRECRKLLKKVFILQKGKHVSWTAGSEVIRSNWKLSDTWTMKNTSAQGLQTNHKGDGADDETRSDTANRKRVLNTHCNDEQKMFCFVFDHALVARIEWSFWHTVYSFFWRLGGQSKFLNDQIYFCIQTDCT